MKKEVIFAFLLFISTFCFSQKNGFNIDDLVEPNEQELLIIERINYLNEMRKLSSNLFWKDFGLNEFPGTIVYFTDSLSYFINPEQSVLDKISKFKALKNPYDFTILRLALPFDAPTFVIQTLFETSEGNKKNINYMLPILFCSSPEVSKTLQPEINSTELWASNTLHEYFHQYQFKIKAIYSYLNVFISQKKMFDKDSMQSIYNKNWNFKDTLVKENDLLLKAINSNSLEAEKNYFTQFLKSRNKRRLEYQKKTKFAIGQIEDLWEKIEGTTLYLEAVLKQNFGQLPPQHYLIQHDTLFLNQNIFSGFNLATDLKYTSIQDADYYFGATGLNLIRLLEKHNVDYKKDFFQYASMPLSTQLKYFYKIK